jgi:hypothetical protein
MAFGYDYWICGDIECTAGLPANTHKITLWYCTTHTCVMSLLGLLIELDGAGNGRRAEQGIYRGEPVDGHFVATVARG